MINYLANPNRFLNFIKPIEFSIGVLSFLFIFFGLYLSLLDDNVISTGIEQLSAKSPSPIFRETQNSSAVKHNNLKGTQHLCN